MNTSTINRSVRPGRFAFCFLSLFVLAVCFTPASAQLVRTGAGLLPTDPTLLSVVATFRNDLGTLNPNVAGSFGSGRREINWDAVPDAFSAPNNLPPTFFNTNSPRGAVFSGPGTGFQVSANAVNPTSTPVEFGNLNPTYPSLFATFSPQKLFTSLGTNVYDVNFFVPGSTTPATVRGFGAVFTDVDLPGMTTIQYFDKNGASLGIFPVPNLPFNETLSFLGVSFPSAVVARVRITQGTAVPGANETLPASDVVVADDFIYGEPIAACPTVTVSIPDAFALPSGVLPNTVYLGYAPASSITLTASVSGGAGPYVYNWSNGTHNSTTTVSPTTTTAYTVSVTDANGCISNTASKTVNVVDVSSGHNGDKVTICHKPNKQRNTLSIGQDGVADHLAHGDMLGSCPSTGARIAPEFVDVSKELNVTAGPNPTLNYSVLKIANARNEKIGVKVTDFYGKLVEQRTVASTTVQLGDNYKPGIYYVEITQGDQRKTLKLVKSN